MLASIHPESLPSFHFKILGPFPVSNDYLLPDRKENKILVGWASYFSFWTENDEEQVKIARKKVFRESIIVFREIMIVFQESIMVFWDSVKVFRESVMVFRDSMIVFRGIMMVFREIKIVFRDQRWMDHPLRLWISDHWVRGEGGWALVGLGSLGEFLHWLQEWKRKSYWKVFTWSCPSCFE